jgi:hypothetical protein
MPNALGGLLPLYNCPASIAFNSGISLCTGSVATLGATSSACTCASAQIAASLTVIG